MFNPRESLEFYLNGSKDFSKLMPEENAAFNKFLGQVYKDGNLDIKTKELISIALSVFTRCEFCIVGHAYNALKAGLSKEEIMEAAMTTVAFGGGPAIAYSVTLLQKSLDEFEKDFQ